MGMYEIISKKRDGGEWSREEIESFIKGYSTGQIPDYQMAALLMAVYLRGLSDPELTALTEAMRDSGGRIDLAEVNGIKIDKHSTGGVGDKISFTVAPLVSSLGVKVPMIAGRALGHTGGTLDKLAAVPGFRSQLSDDAFRSVLAEAGMAIAGQSDTLVPADRMMYALRDSTATVSSLPLIASSIMSKKLAVGTDGLVLDIKTGSGAFMARIEDALALCRTMVAIGEGAGRRTSGLITDMDQPLGKMVGNALEIAESIATLKGEGPADVITVTCAVGALMLRLAGDFSPWSELREKLQRELASGRPLDRFRKFLRAQGGDGRVIDDCRLLPQAPIRLDLAADRSGIVTAIDTFAVGMVAVDLGAGRRKKEDEIDPGAGLEFHKKTGDRVEIEEPLVTIHASNREKAVSVTQALLQAFFIGSRPPDPRPLVHALVDRDGVHPWSY